MAEALAGVLPVVDAVRRAVAVLAQAGCESPRLDAELLLAAALGVGRERLLIDASTPLLDPARAVFDAYVARRLAREPVAYILARKEFRRITLAVDRRALIPRPETELLVEVGSSVAPGARVVDVGTGSGAVALALADERPDLSLTATDIDADALALAGSNASRLGLPEVRFEQADLLVGVQGPFDAVLANLPYVPDGFPLAPEIASYEPPSALFAGADGLDLVRRLVAMLGAVPTVALEVGAGQAPAVRELLAGAGYGAVESVLDLAGHERVVVGRR
ncbi:MAG: peptide chain release factor N(5)-glutamine methyltransferase [Solirubrobacteraceae bacterium]